MKRIVIGTFNQCMSIIKKSEKMGDEGYDYYDLHETTIDERVLAVDNTIGKKVSFYANTDRDKHRQNGNLYTLTLYRDNETRKNNRNFNRAMKVLV